jgi:NADH dehydrogenase (ubiquinone) Fe-S protein 1
LAKFLYLLNADNITAADIPRDSFVVYQGHHGDAGAHYADVVLPGCAYTEKSATFVNTEGRSQLTRAAVSPPGESREDWQIVRALSQVLGKTLPYDDVDAVRERMAEYAPHLINYGAVESSSLAKQGFAFLQESLKGTKKIGSASEFKPVLDDFYLADPISRASSTMAKCSQTFLQSKAEENKAQAQA